MIGDRKNILRRAIGDWRDREMISVSLSAILLDDLDANTGQRSFGWIAVLLGTICLGFALFAFVSANWDQMSSLARVALVFASMWTIWGIAILFKLRGNDRLGESFLALASAAFGAGIMLISQIYHMQGNAADAVWLWAAGTMAAALLTRSYATLSLAIILFFVWFSMTSGDISLLGRLHFWQYLLYWTVGAAAAWWLKSRLAAHLSMAALSMSIILKLGFSWFIWQGPGHPFAYTSNAMILPCAFLLFTLLLWQHDKIQRIPELALPALSYLLFGIAIALFGVLQPSGITTTLMISKLVTFTGFLPLLVSALPLGIAAMARNHPNRYDLAINAIFALGANLLLMLYAFAWQLHPVWAEKTAYTWLRYSYFLAMSIWVIRMGWRLEYRPINVLGFIGFAAIMLVIYAKTVGSLLQTALFFVLAGVIILAVTWLSKKRFSKRADRSKTPTAAEAQQ